MRRSLWFTRAHGRNRRRRRSCRRSRPNSATRLRSPRRGWRRRRASYDADRASRPIAGRRDDRRSGRDAGRLGRAAAREGACQQSRSARPNCTTSTWAARKSHATRSSRSIAGRSKPSDAHTLAEAVISELQPAVDRRRRSFPRRVPDRHVISPKIPTTASFTASWCAGASSTHIP
jgi:hypothetical protein